MATTEQARSTINVPEGPSPTHDTFHQGRYSLLLRLNEEMIERIEDLASRTGYDKAELINVSLALLKMSLDAIEEGKQVGIVDEDGAFDTEFTGFHKYDQPVE